MQITHEAKRPRTRQPIHGYLELHMADIALPDDFNGKRSDRSVHEQQTVQQGDQLSVHAPASRNASFELTGILKSLGRRDLLSTSLTKFDDC